jgi:hypothetical protein
VYGECCSIDRFVAFYYFAGFVDKDEVGDAEEGKVG